MTAEYTIIELKKHSSDRYLLQSDILCLTESQPLPNESTDAFIAQFGKPLNINSRVLSLLLVLLP